MKKFRILFFCALMLFVFKGWSQDQLFITKVPAGTSRYTNPMQCKSGSIFSQVPNRVSSSWEIDNQRRLADDYTVPSWFHSMRFWGMDMNVSTFTTCQPPEMTFNIRFYKRNPSNPMIPGDEFQSFTLTTAPQYMNIWFGGDYQVDFVFPTPVMLTDGWVSITRTDQGDPCWAFWHAESIWWEPSSDNACYYGWIGADQKWEWVSTINDGYPSGMAFCLGDPDPNVPLTNWALIIGFVLIGTLIIVRYRKT